jgi:hypothetical protein
MILTCSLLTMQQSISTKIIGCREENPWSASSIGVLVCRSVCDAEREVSGSTKFGGLFWHCGTRHTMTDWSHEQLHPCFIWFKGGFSFKIGNYLPLWVFLIPAIQNTADSIIMIIWKLFYQVERLQRTGMRRDHPPKQISYVFIPYKDSLIPRTTPDVSSKISEMVYIPVMVSRYCMYWLICITIPNRDGGVIRTIGNNQIWSYLQQ